MELAVGHGSCRAADRRAGHADHEGDERGDGRERRARERKLARDAGVVYGEHRDVIRAGGEGDLAEPVAVEVLGDARRGQPAGNRVRSSWPSAPRSRSTAA